MNHKSKVQGDFSGDKENGDTGVEIQAHDRIEDHANKKEGRGMKNLESMNRKEWKSYKKRMKKLEKRHNEFPETKTVEEIEEHTDFLIEEERRIQKQTEKIQKATWFFVGISIVAFIVSFAFSILSYLKKKDKAANTPETIAPTAENIAAINANTEILFEWIEL